MKRLHNSIIISIIVISIMIMVSNMSAVFASSMSNYELAESYVARNFPQCQMVVFTHYDANIMENRANTNVVYVEKFVSYSKGKYGYSKKGEYIKYNKKVKKGKKVTSYIIYNPYTNYCDDVVAVIDNHKIR